PVGTSISCGKSPVRTSIGGSFMFKTVFRPFESVKTFKRVKSLFNITISGEYVNNVTYTDVTNGTFIATLITPLPEREEIFWNVEVVDPRGKIVTVEYKFTTFVEI
ncbi:MAG: hypothetical protein NTV74_06670, partial [Euryarchaeota archaeon]|nr:hypothetical protein [Euryarchaeota archaeon]